MRRCAKRPPASSGSAGSSSCLCAGGVALAWRSQRSIFEHQQKAAEAERRALRGHYDFLTRFGNDAIVFLDGDGTILEVNDRAIEWFGYSREEFQAMHISQLRAPEAAAGFGRMWEELHRQKSLMFETTHRRKDGSVFPVEISARIIDIDGRAFIQGILRDTSERQRANDQINRVNRLYAVLSGCSRCIVESRTPEDLFARVCRIAAETGGFRLVSISFITPGTTELVNVARDGESAGYIDRIALATEGPLGDGAAGRSLRERRPIVCNDFLDDPTMLPWREEAARFGLRSSIALPLRKQGQEVGVLGLYAGEPGFFDEAEAKLAEEVADSVSFALDSIEQDVRRRQADAELRVGRERLERVLDVIDEGYWDWHPGTDEVHLSARYHTMLGYMPGELAFGWDAWLAMTHPTMRRRSPRRSSDSSRPARMPSPSSIACAASPANTCGCSAAAGWRIATPVACRRGWSALTPTSPSGGGSRRGSSRPRSSRAWDGWPVASPTTSTTC